jgi:hypothetical protein
MNQWWGWKESPRNQGVMHSQKPNWPLRVWGWEESPRNLGVMHPQKPNRPLKVWGWEESPHNQGVIHSHKAQSAPQGLRARGEPPQSGGHALSQGSISPSRFEGKRRAPTIRGSCTLTRLNQPLKVWRQEESPHNQGVMHSHKAQSAPQVLREKSQS